MKINLKKHIGTISAFALSGALILSAAFFPQKKPEAEAAQRVVRVWNVDTFEGGKGSRTNFLKSVARRAEQERDGVFFLISSYTLEGAKEAFRSGDAPDILSFGVGLDDYAERALPLPYEFSGGELGGKTLAVPWCRGGYALFSLTDDFEEEGNTAISVGGNNLAEVAARLMEIDGEPTPSLSAYASFLSGKFRYLLGTQRDLCRFRARETAVYFRPLPKYCDLYQYVSVLSAQKREDCLAFVAELLSDRTRERLGELGMYPPDLDDPFAALPERTLGAFASQEARSKLLLLARGGESPKNLEKYLKTV